MREYIRYDKNFPIMSHVKSLFSHKQNKAIESGWWREIREVDIICAAYKEAIFAIASQI